jgi:hypothetical protein
MDSYDEVYVTMNREQLWTHLVKVVRENGLTVNATWYGSGDSGELSDYDINGDKADEKVSCISSEYKYVFDEVERQTKSVVSSEHVRKPLREYILDLMDRMAQVAHVDWYNGDGGVLEMEINDSNANWSEQYHKVITELYDSLGDPSEK